MSAAAVPYQQFMPPQQAGPSTGNAQLVCGGCQSLLMYPSGAANVRCSRCQHVTPAPPSASTDTAQLVCNGCRVLLSYPRGANRVQCSICQTVTQVPVYGHLVCGGCSIMLMYPMGAQSVKCSVCQYITPAPPTPAPMAGAMRPAGPPVPPRPAKPPTQTVVVENPPSLDDAGNEVANIAVGVKQEK